FYRKSRSFEKWFDQSMNAFDVEIDGIANRVVIQDQNQNNNKDLSDDKYLITKLETDVKVGSHITYGEEEWIVFSNEFKTIQTHKQVKMKEVNHYIKWMINGEISGKGKGYPAFIQNQTLYTLGVSTSGNNAWIVNAKMMMYLPDNAETRTIGIGQRVVIGGSVYQVMFRDYVSRRGLVHFLLEQDMVAPDRDNLELEIADYWTGVNPPKDDGEGSN